MMYALFVCLLFCPEDKRKIVQISDTSAKFYTLDPLQVVNDLRQGSMKEPNMFTVYWPSKNSHMFYITHRVPNS